MLRPELPRTPDPSLPSGQSLGESLGRNLNYAKTVGLPLVGRWVFSRFKSRYRFADHSSRSATERLAEVWSAKA